MLKLFDCISFFSERLYTSEKAQVERAGDLDGFQGEGGRTERESDWIDHLCVHQQLGTLTAVPQTGLWGQRREQNGMQRIIIQLHFLAKKAVYNFVLCLGTHGKLFNPFFYVTMCRIIRFSLLGLAQCINTSGLNYLYGAYKCDRHSLLKLVDWSVEVQDLHNLKDTTEEGYWGKSSRILSALR